MKLENSTGRPNITPPENCECGCVAYAYVPIQCLKDTYKPAVALTRGTLFPELDLTISEYGKVCKATGGIM